jgi:hypothetical protein
MIESLHSYRHMGGSGWVDHEEKRRIYRSRSRSARLMDAIRKLGHDKMPKFSADAKIDWDKVNIQTESLRRSFHSLGIETGSCALRAYAVQAQLLESDINPARIKVKVADAEKNGKSYLVHGMSWVELDGLVVATPEEYDAIRYYYPLGQVINLGGTEAVKSQNRQRQSVIPQSIPRFAFSQS